MTDAVASIQYSDVPGFPAGSVVDHIEITLTGAKVGVLPAISAPPGTASVTIPGLADDSYTFAVEAVDAKDGLFGTPVTGSFTIVSGASVTLSLPSTATIAQK